eukprot:Opistho-1_new@49436
MLPVEVEAHDARLRVEDVLGVRGVLHRERADHAGALLAEVVRAIAHRKQVVVLRVPAQRRHRLALRLVVHKLPQRQQRALVVAEFVRLVLPVLEVLGNVVECVLVHHALDDLRRSQHRRAVHNVLRLRLDLRQLLLLLVLLHAGALRHGRRLLVLQLRLPLLVFRVRVVNLPLIHSRAEVGAWRGLGRRRAVPQRVVERLASALAEVELVAQHVLLARPSARSLTARVRSLPIPIAAVVIRGSALDGDLLRARRDDAARGELSLGLVRALVEHVPLELKVHCRLVDGGRELVHLFLVAEAHNVLRGVRVVRAEDAREVLLQLLLRQLQLVLGLEQRLGLEPLVVEGVVAHGVRVRLVLRGRAKRRARRPRLVILHRHERRLLRNVRLGSHRGRRGQLGLWLGCCRGRHFPPRRTATAT